MAHPPTLEPSLPPVESAAVPRSLSPSKLSKFTSCPRAFRYVYIDHLPELPTVPQVKGTLVHAALERLFWRHPRGTRTVEAALGELEEAHRALRDEEDSEWAALELTADGEAALVGEARHLIENYFVLEDPNDVHSVGIEIGLEAEIGDLRLRGIIDRLDVTDDGGFVVVDYKTGRAPSDRYERGNLAGVHVYAVLCQLTLGRAPVEVRLLHLREPVALTVVPTEQALRGNRQRALAVWKAIERACRTGDFRPRPSALCASCSFRHVCPAVGGAAPVELVS